jgi:phosphoribosylformylglycinamidine synthase II
MKDSFQFSKMSDSQVKKILARHQIGLTVDEARKIEKILKRPPTLTEAVLWGIQGSEHCSYKSSRTHLKILPTKAPNVVLGVGEDAGIVEIAQVKGDRFGLIVSHESHNHPSQIVPFEGAATGIGGCVRDVACMGGKVLGVMDPLRFGEISKNEPRQIAGGVISGIAGYGNPIGVPNLGGDIFFDPSYNENCLVNVVAIGMVRESHLIHSFVSKEAAKEQWDIIIVGKPTDFSGMGGAAFASGILKAQEKEKNKGAVQEPNPFLKRHLLVATYDLFALLQQKKLIKKVSFKDMGAGGITTSTVEQVAKQNLGAEIDLNKVHTAFADLPPEVIACGETQERFTWMCHPSLTRMILDHYNKKWDLPSIAQNARASHIGRVTSGNFVLKYKGKKVVNAPSKDITEGLKYDRPYRKVERKLHEPKIALPKNFNKILLQLLASENIASRKPAYERYDKQVQGYVVLEAGLADASILAPLIDENVDSKTKKTGMAFSVDSNPRQSLISSYHGAANAVVESMRNVAAVGAYPQALTDCLNYGNPEKSDQMAELVEGIEGIRDACEGIPLKNHPGISVPVISGNVSLYNESKGGHVAPSAIICCIGKIDNYEKAVTMQLKKAGNYLYLLGERKDELGGSEYYRLFGKLGANVPRANFDQARKEIYTLVDAISAGLVLSAHDINEGGLAVCAAEMAFGGWGDGRIGFQIDLKKVPRAELREDQKLFSETGGFMVEIAPKNQKKFLALCAKNKLAVFQIGKTIKSPRLQFKNGAQTVIDLPVGQAAERWMEGLREKL